VRVPAAVVRPVVFAGAIREEPPGDYLRVAFVPAGVPVTTLSRPGALRAFLTATPLYAPALRVADLPAYSGLQNDDAAVLVAMRCRPPDPRVVDALLATWPNVFLAIGRDVTLDPAACAVAPANPATAVACFAREFTDPASTDVPTSLAATLGYAAALFDGRHLAIAGWLRDKYGIFPSFSGLGYSVKGSYDLATEPMTSQQILVASVSPEYLLRNVTLAAAGCRCIAVAPYPGRSRAPLDPDFVARAGGDGVCTTVEALR
jgi:hypothetical protein